ncbi:hypothetical protein K144316041_13300 [Clostridium tetani]|uniref:hypothetical protein n=1 Tax=Clostridium tetani TaxID=1513 RepID=UPI00100B7ACD|nr:hypothetical protein [Clostridium tetani]RXM55466.1 hypothetical protein DP134_05265 [Clostridium tetani]BDR64406.1 hypothetical protein K134307016_13400 [Clostridium tetani]BDR67187.1 hypothetical protein K144312032_14150 [Clostridium tetani]BDR72622.1 hypothetical protein K144316041_13300 [Clostridium tetani]
MKKLLSILTVFILSFSLVACGGSEPTDAKKEDTKQEQKKEEKKKEIKMPDKEIGKGKIEISTPAGTSENGNIPSLFTSKDDQVVQIALNSEDFDGSKLSYIFVDGEEIAREQLSDTQTAIDLKGSALKVGKHKVDIVQFDNDKTDGKIITYKTANYECKEK